MSNLETHRSKEGTPGVEQPHTTVQAGNWLAGKQLCSKKEGVSKIMFVLLMDDGLNICLCLCGENVCPQAGLDLIGLQLPKLKVQ